MKVALAEVPGRIRRPAGLSIGQELVVVRQMLERH